MEDSAWEPFVSGKLEVGDGPVLHGELTEMLRADDCVIPLRQFLREAGLEPDSLFMARFVENAEGVVPGGDDVDIGVVVTAGGEVRVRRADLPFAPVRSPSRSKVCFGSRGRLAGRRRSARL